MVHIQTKNYSGYYTRKEFSSHTLRDYLDALPSDNNTQKLSEDRYITNCVAHEDRNPSMAISQGNKQVVFKCFAGCDQSNILKYFQDKLGGRS